MASNVWTAAELEQMSPAIGQLRHDGAVELTALDLDLDTDWT